jgi:hypothetical protein
MSAQRISVVLRLRLHTDLSIRQIIDSLKLSLGAIQKVTHKAEASVLFLKKTPQLKLVLKNGQ